MQPKSEAEAVDSSAALPRSLHSCNEESSSSVVDPASSESELVSVTMTGSAADGADESGSSALDSAVTDTEANSTCESDVEQLNVTEEDDNVCGDMKRNKIESVVSTPAAPSKLVFGSAAKSTVSFTSLAGDSKLPIKSLFAEPVASASEGAKGQERPSKPQDSEYEVVTGEEDEETISTAKGKLYEFSPASKDWCEKGVGLMKLNKSRDEEMFRIVMRTDGVQRLILNSRLFSGMVCERVQEKNIRFSAYNQDGKIQTYLFRMKNVEEAISLEDNVVRALGALDFLRVEDC